MGCWWIHDGDRTKKSTNGTWYTKFSMILSPRVLVEKNVPLYDGMVFKVCETVFKVDQNPSFKYKANVLPA